MRTYRPTRGLVVGVVGAAAAVIAGAVFFVGSPSVGSAEMFLGLLVFAWVVWAALLRPCVRLGDRDVHVVGSVTTVQIPCERIEGVSVRQFLEIDTGERRFTCAAIGHSRRALSRATQVPLRGLVVEEGGRSRVESEAERLRELIEQSAAAAHRRPRRPVPPIARSWDRLPLLLLALLALGLVATVVVGTAA